MTPSERAAAMGYGRRCCAGCRWLGDDNRCGNAKADVAGMTRSLGDVCREWREREVGGE